jgi:hypothetical protein
MIDMANHIERGRVEDHEVVTGYGMYEKRMLRHINPSYDVGYVIGSYLSIGSCNTPTYKNSTRGIVFWYIEETIPDDIINKLLYSMDKGFGLRMVVRDQKKSSTKQVVCYSKPLATLFSNFGKKSGKKMLPNRYLPEEINYRLGVADGIYDFKGNVVDSRAVTNKRNINMEVIILYNKLRGY